MRCHVLKITPSALAGPRTDPSAEPSRCREAGPGIARTDQRVVDQQSHSDGSTPATGRNADDDDDDDDDKDDDGYSSDLLLASKILAEEVPGLPHRPLWILRDIVANEECAQTMHLMQRTDGAIIICQAPRPSDPAVALRISFAREVPLWITAPKVV